MEFHQLLGIISCLLSMVIASFLGFKMYKKYQIDRSINELYISISLFSGGIATLFLGLESLFLNLAPSTNLPVLTIFITLLSVIFMVLFQGLFAYHTFLPKYERALVTYGIIFTSAYIVVIFIFPPSIVITVQEIVVVFPTMLLMLTLGPLIIGNIFLHFFYSISMRKQSTPHSALSFWLGISTTILYLLFALEVIITDIRLANFLRISYVFIPILYYFLFTRFIEMDWPKSIRHLYIIYEKQGIALYNYSFITEEMVATQLIAGGISGVTDLMKIITHSRQKLHFLDQGDIKIILEYGNYIIGVLISDANFGILRKKLNLLVDTFENRFSDVLANFKGNITPFENAKEIIDSIFSKEMLFDVKLI